jgi:hypothetical protein
MAILRRLRIYAFTALTAVIPLGLASKAYRGPAAAWVEGYSGDILYEMAWMFFCVGLWPAIARAKQGLLKLALGVFAVTAGFEFLQRWQPPWLQAWRATLPGKLILGTTFVPWDFFYYALGCLIGWAILQLWQRQLGLGPQPGQVQTSQR